MGEWAYTDVCVHMFVHKQWMVLRLGRRLSCKLKDQSLDSQQPWKKSDVIVHACGKADTGGFLKSTVVLACPISVLQDQWETVSQKLVCGMGAAEMVQ